MSLKAILVILVIGGALTGAAFLVWHKRYRFGRSFPRFALVAFPSGLALMLLAAYVVTHSVGCVTNPDKNRPKVAWTKASGEVPDLVLPKAEIEKTSVVLAAPSSDNLKLLSAVVNEKQNLAVYNAIFSPLSALGNNVLADGQPTRVDFYIGDPSKDNAIPTDNITINSQSVRQAPASDRDAILQFLRPADDSERIKRGFPSFRTNFSSVPVKVTKSASALVTKSFRYRIAPALNITPRSTSPAVE